MGTDRPKEIFVFIADPIAALGMPDGLRILDVGCASGALLHYFRRRFPSAALSGTDVSEVLVARARELLLGGEFFVGSLDSEDALARRNWDVTCCVGVLCYFDDIARPLLNLVRSVRDGGTVLMSTMINPHPIDVSTRHRRSTPGGQGVWEIGWNIFSRETYEATLRRMKSELTWQWHPVDMPFALEKTDDPMRSWTIGTEEKEFQLVNGASQLINMQVLEIAVGRMLD